MVSLGTTSSIACVSLVASSKAKGAGTNYLVQHSAGSGKSNSIAWLAHRLASLHDASDRKVYDAVVVLTDRTILDQQLQETISQIEHKTGVVEKIDKDSAPSSRRRSTAGRRSSSRRSTSSASSRGRSRDSQSPLRDHRR